MGFAKSAEMCGRMRKRRANLAMWVKDLQSFDLCGMMVLRNKADRRSR